MGSSESIGHLYVQLDSPIVQTGEEITGIIHLKLDTDIQVKSVVLKFTGKEDFTWEISGNETGTNFYSGHELVVNKVFPVFTFQDSYAVAGEYSFPFSYSIPSTLPASFEVVFGCSKAYIKYYLKAYLLSKATVKREKSEVRITRKGPEAIGEVSTGLTARVLTWCFIPQGTITTRMHLDKSEYTPGETIEMEAEIDNSRSRLTVQGIRASLLQILRMIDEPEHIVIHKVTMNEVYIAHTLTPGQTLIGDSRLRIQILVNNAKGDMNSASTARGRKVICTYIVSLKAEVTGSCMCCGQVPAVDHEVIIHPLQLPIQPPPIAPEGWNPTVMPIAHFKADSSPSTSPLSNQV